MLFDKKTTMNMLVTLNCDSKCKHCYIGSLDDNSSIDLPVDIWKHTFKLFKESGGKDICIHGGEPLLYSGLNQVLEYANDIGLSTSIITNTFHLNDDLIELFKRCNTYVLLSLDGPEKNYKLFRGENKFDLVLNNVDKLLQQGITVHPICVVHNENIMYLDWIEQFAVSKNIKTVTLSPLQPVGRAGQQNQYFITPNQIGSLVDIISKLNKTYKGTTRFVTQALYKPEDIDKYKNDKNMLLSYNDDILNIMNDGRVLADLDIPNRFDYVIGCIPNADIDDQKIDAYKDLLEAAYHNGLQKLNNGDAINFFEIVQKTSIEFS